MQRFLLMYLAAGIGVAAWNISRAKAGKGIMTFVENPSADFVAGVVLWPASAVHNLIV